MRTQLSMIVLAAGACALAACNNVDLRKESPPASQSMTTTSATTVGPIAEFHDPAALADNAGQVRRFADEVTFAPRTSKLVVVPATVRAMPLGAEVVTVFDNTDVVLTEVARDHDYYLVVFSDPTGGNKRLAGWIYKDRLEGSVANAVEAVSPRTCATGEVYVLGDGLCAKACTRDVDCAASSGVCDGNSLVSNGSHAPSHAQYCVGAGEAK